MKRLIAALFALTTIAVAAGMANYTATQGFGTNFGSIVVGGVHYAQQLVCDPTTPAQCAAVDASGIVTVKGTVTVTGVATSANQTSQITQETATAAALDVAGTSPCASPTTACALLQLIQGMWTDVRNGAGATGAAPPASAIYVGANTGGATGGFQQGLIQCNNHVFKHITSPTDTPALQGVTSQTGYLCDLR